MPAPDPIRRAAVAHAAALLVEVVGEGAPVEPAAVVVSDGTIEVRVVVARCQEGAAAGSSAAPARLTGLDRLILAAATAEPQTMTRLANHTGRSGHDTDSYYRGRVRRLVRLGRLLWDAEGYRLP